MGAGALIMLLTAAAYLPALHGGFSWDDDTLITQNRMVKASDGLFRFWFTSESPDYRPLTWSLWWLEWRLWGDTATGYHVVNVLLHAIDAVLVWLVLRRLKVPGAWLAAAVFAIHPVNVATVAWISEQKNTLSMLFYALAILSYLRFDEAGHWRWYGASLAAYLLALLSKTAVVMLPVVLLGCVWWRHNRLRTKDWWYTLPYFAASLVLALVTIVQHQRPLKGIEVWGGGVGARLAVAGWIPWFYLSKALLPINLMVIYPKWKVDSSNWLSYVPGIILVGCLIVFWWNRPTWGRPLLFGLGYFVVTLFPVMGFFDQAFYRFSLVADHWQYHSIAGVIALAVAAAQRMSNRLDRWELPGRVVMSAIVLGLLGATTWNRNRVYANSEALWQDNLTKNPAAEVAHYNLGVILEHEDTLPEAITHFEQALQLNPDSADTHNNLGAAFYQLGRTREAIAQYEEALRLKPDFAEAHYNLGIALKQMGSIAEAIAHYEQALKIRPDYSEAHYNLGNSLLQAGRIKDAIAHYEEAVRIRPDYVEAHYNLGIALEQSGRVEEAVRHWERVLQINPHFTEAQERLTRLRVPR